MALAMPYIGWRPRQPARAKPAVVVNHSPLSDSALVRVPNLASHILSLRRGKCPLIGWPLIASAWLLKRWVDATRYHGGCYRAATGPRWITQGRGRMDRSGKAQGYATHLLFPLTATGESALHPSRSLPRVSMNLLNLHNLPPDWRQVSARSHLSAARRLTCGSLVCRRLHLTSRAISPPDASCRLECLCTVSAPAVPESAPAFDPIFDRQPASLPRVGAGDRRLDDTLCKKTGRIFPCAKQPARIRLTWLAPVCKATVHAYA